jgi:hypothetical protein
MPIGNHITEWPPKKHDFAAVQTAIEYEYRFTEYRFTEYRFAEYEYDDIRCEDDQVVCLIALNSQPQSCWIHRHL